MFFKIIDGHCDTISKIYNSTLELKSNNLHVDLNKLRYSNCSVQFFAAFTDKIVNITNTYDIFKEILSQIYYFYNQIEKNSCEIVIAKSYNDIINAEMQGKISALLSVEGGECIQNNINNLYFLYALGIRAICLTWNYKNQIACGAYQYKDDKGLTQFGRLVVEKMNKLGIIIDVSHMSERSFYDVIEHSKKPVIASHSNCRKLCDNIRNLSDRQIKQIAEKGGIVGINFYPPFLNSNKKATVFDIIKHIEHICSLVGVDHVCLGSDFDGINNLPDNMKDYSSINTLVDILIKKNYNEKNIEKILYSNYMRIIKQIIG